jgi:ABC-type transport system involved in multi-copper enzyme maturation permease subunit
LYTLPLSGIGLSETIRLWLPFVLDKLFLTIGVLLAILVTSTAVPQMLEEGSLYLLLSKPQTRLFLLLTKYVGSGLMIFIISALFLTGVWLILGARFNVWMVEVLWCIPLAVVIYLVYYSVTVGVGLIFRNVVLSIIATILFAGTCYLLSFSRYSYSGLVAFQRTSELQMVGDTLVRRSAHNHAEFYDSTTGRWELGLYGLGNDMPPEMFATMSAFMPSVHSASPAYLPDKQLYVGELQFFPPRPDLAKRLAVARKGQPGELAKPHILGEIPFGSLGFWADSDQRLHVVTSYGTVLRLSDAGQQIVADAAQGKFPARVAATSEDGAGTTSSSQATVTAAPATTKDPNANADQDDDGITSEEDDEQPESGAANSENGVLEWLPVGNIAYDTARSLDRIVFTPDHGTCYSLGRTTISRGKRSADGNYQIDLTVALPWEWTAMNRVPLGLVQGKLLVPLRGRSLVVFDADSLEPVADLQMPRSGIPLSLSCNEELGLAIVTYANGETWQFDASDNSFQRRRFVRGSATSTVFDSSNRLVIANGIDDLATVQLPDGSLIETPPVQKNLIRNIYDWCLEPIYSIFPKPNECYVLIQHLANDGSVDSNRAEDTPVEIDIDTFSAQTDNPWSPILTSGVFAIVLMLFNCWYFWRQEY